MITIPDELRELYSFESNYLKLPEDLDYHYLDEGEGEPLLCVHGNPTWSFYYRDVARVFREDRRVIVPDHIGCGLSEKPQNYDYRLVQHVDNLERLILHLDLSDITLMVHDWGGPIGLGAATRHPERFKRIILTNTAAFRSNFMPFLLSICRLPLIGELLIRGLNAFAGLAPWIAVADPRAISPLVRKGYWFPYNSWANRIATHRFVVDIPSRPGHPSYNTLVEIEENLPKLSHLPCQVFWGDKDWVFTPQFIPRFLEIFPDHELHRFSDIGHLVVEEAGARLIPRMRDFLS